MFSHLRLSIRTQLYASSIVTCLMLVVLVGIAALQLRRLSRETTELSSETKFIMTLATSIEKVPSGHRWVHEVKFDGYRVQGSPGE